MVAMDPHTGRVLAHGRRLFLRPVASSTARPRRCASPARRSSRSSMPPRSTTATRRPRSVLDAPIAIDQGPGHGSGSRRTTSGTSLGPHTLRYGIEHSRNLMTVRLAQDVGMPLIAEYAQALRHLRRDAAAISAMSLGAGETTLLRMVTGYSMFVNGGKRIKPTLIDRIQDRWGKTIYRHDERDCDGCDAAEMGRTRTSRS